MSSASVKSPGEKRRGDWWMEGNIQLFRVVTLLPVFIVGFVVVLVGVNDLAGSRHSACGL